MRPEFNENSLLIDNIIKNREDSLNHVQQMIRDKQFDRYSEETLNKFCKTLTDSINFYKSMK